MKSIGFLATTALASTMLFSTAAFAQVANDDATAPPVSDAPNQLDAQQASTEEAREGDIVVVGSRIRRDVFDSPAPIQVITRDESTLAGFNTTTQVLQSTAVTGGTAQVNNAFGGFVTDGGPGANTLSLRGLGATRTLILLNGRRLAPAGSRGSVGSADLNVLPSAIVDRIEILKDGASSIYGSDAVAGVVNIVTRKKVTGVTLEGQYNVTEEGGGSNARLSSVFGVSGDRYNISASLEYIQRESLDLRDREFTQCNTDYRVTAANRTPGSGDFIDPATGQPKCYPVTGTGSNGVTINTIGTNSRPGIGAPGSVTPGALSNFNRFRPNAAITAGLPGFEGVGGGANNLNVRDTFDPRTLNRSLISPGKAYTGYVQGGYDLQALGNAEIYAELLYSRRESSQVGYRQLSLDYNFGSPLIPAALATSVFSGPQATSGTNNVGVRAFIGFGNDRSSQEVDFYRTSGGLRGDFFGSGWRYDLNLSYSKSDANYTFESFLTDRLTRSLDVVPNGAGGFACRNPAGGCVAAPSLTAAVIGGQLPADFVNYVFVPVTGSTKFTEYTVNFGFDGPLFELPYGKVQTAFGVEYRKSRINDTPAADSQAGNLYNLTSSSITRGSDSVYEIYGEVEVPVLRNVPFFKELTLNASGRHTDYKSYGSDQTYKFGLLWSPASFLSFRATYGTSYRAPALYEQFLGATTGFLSSNGDPCNNFNAPGVNPTRAANCASEGLPPGFVATSGITVVNSGGAASGLAAETSKNYTIGVILQPKLPESIGNLSLAVDYYRINVRNGVSRAGAGNILTLCYDDPQFRAGGGFCRLVNPRNPSSQALTVNDSFVNLSQDLVRGIDYNLRYTRDIGQGQLRLSAAVTQFIDQSSRLFADDPLDDINGTVAAPKFTGDFDASYTWRDFRVRYGVEWIDATNSYDYLGVNPDTGPFIFETNDYFTHNLSFRYAPEKYSLTLGVRNLTDRKPPQISSGFYNRIGNAPLYSGYDYVGRQFFVNVSKSF